MSGRRWRVLLGAAMVFSASCYAEEIADLRGQVERMQRCQVCGQRQLQKGLALALCRPPVRQLIDDVAQVCKREDICLDQKIATLVGDADPTHLGRFVAMMSGQTHSVLYFTPKDTLIDGLEGVYLQRLKRTIQPQPPWLETTKFLVVSNLPPPPLGQTGTSKLSTQDPQVARAERRGLQIIEKLLDIQFPGGQKLKRDQVLHWVYSFSLKKREYLNPDDMPPVGSELARSVWVFRIDCATP
ncbi:MAG TPA: hypothetical protein PKI49_15330, partial [Pseudomonadota bacterium]|nr:hypothetical protein [Pseudomonadota bacterium]